MSTDAAELPTISKSSFLAGIQCSKLLWMKFNEKEAFPEVSETLQAIFEQGHEVGALAKLVYPGGIEVAEGRCDYAFVLEETAKVLRLAECKPLYEAAIAHEGGYARIDILNPSGGGPDAWEIIEVKSGTKVKDENLIDVAFQKFLCEGAGLKISGCFLMHVNSEYVRENEEIELEKLLVAENVDARIAAVAAELDIPGTLRRLRELAAQDACPEVEVGPHCTAPYECDLIGRCWAFLPRHPVTSLCRDSKGRRWEYLEAGILGLADIPEDDVAGLGPKHRIQRETARSGEAHVDRPAIAAFLETLKHPVAYFDLESFQRAVPPFLGMRPYRQIPFQFSVHVQAAPGADLEHHEFLAEANPSDPRKALMEASREAIPERGSIVAYNAAFEKSALGACAAAYPEFQPWVEAVLPRFVDLLAPFNRFDYYHPGQEGSASIKAVLPVLTETSYAGLAIAEGAAASLGFVEMAYQGASAERVREIRANLLEYCALDTMAMVQIVEALRGMVEEG